MSTPDAAQVLSAQFSTVARTDLTAAALATWDPTLSRPPRVLVPMDVQALAIPAGNAEPDAQVLSPLPDPIPQQAGAAPSPGQAAAQLPKIAPFTDGAARAPGLYLHWAAVDGLAAARAQAGTGEPVTGNTTSLPLADRWLVVRVASGTPRRTRAWVVEAERGLTADLSSWSESGTAAGGRTPNFPSSGLTATAGGDPAWAAVFDTSQDRFGIYDPLDDLTDEDRRGTISYLVCGWWSQDANDPIYSGTLAERADLLGALKWTHAAVSSAVQAERDLAVQRGVQTGTPTTAVRAATGVDSSGQATGDLTTMSANQVLTGGAAEVVAGASPPLPQLTLLHGSVIGVLPGGPGQSEDDRPAATDVEVAVGASATEAFAALLALDQPADQQVADERLVAAFGDGLISQLDAPDGLVTLDQELQAAEFVAQPGGTATTDRVVDGDRIAAAEAKRDAATNIAGQITSSESALTAASADRKLGFLAERSSFETIAVQQTKTGTPAASAQLTPRELAVAAPSWRFPADPVVTLRTVNRSLRHGYDGRFNPDDTLSCRVSGEARTQFAGLVDGAELVAPLGNGGLPPECDDLLCELVLEDTTQLPATASYAAQARSLPVAAVTARLTAEYALRWDSTVSPAAKDAMRPASLWVGTEASPLATTSWRQPWVPLFLEWQLTLTVDDDMSRWTLAEVDLDVADGVSPEPDPSVPPIVTEGRVLLTSMVARQFAAKVADFVNEEAQRGPAGAVLLPAEQAALSAIAQSGARFDVLSAGLQGLREELLGLAWADAGRTVVQDGTSTPPTPIAPPVLLRGGVASFTRLRLVDSFGRTLEIPAASITGAAVAERLQIPPAPAPAPAPAEGQASPAPQLLLRPRLMRPARLELSFVDPTAPDGTVPPAATVDQVDPTQAINPVCGWLLPDHLDGSLEVYDGTAGQLGMLLEDFKWPGRVGGRSRLARPGRCAARAAAKRQRRGSPHRPFRRGRRGRRRGGPDGGGRRGCSRAERERAVRAPAGHRHDAVDGRPVREHRHRACGRPRRTPDRRRADDLEDRRARRSEHRPGRRADAAAGCPGGAADGLRPARESADHRPPRRAHPDRRRRARLLRQRRLHPVHARVPRGPGRRASERATRGPAVGGWPGQCRRPGATADRPSLRGRLRAAAGHAAWPARDAHRAHGPGWLRACHERVAPARGGRTRA